MSRTPVTDKYPGHFSHIILTLVSQTVLEGRLALQSWTHSRSKQSPRWRCSHACRVQAINWQRFETPLKQPQVKEMDSETADNQADLQSVSTIYLWLCKVNSDTKRREKKIRDTGTSREKCSNMQKISLTTLPSKPCGQLDATAEESRTRTDRHACRNAVSGPIWARRQSLAGMAWVIRHEDSSGYNALGNA